MWSKCGLCQHAAYPNRRKLRPDIPSELVLCLERATRIELAFSAWEADVLPLNYARRYLSLYRVLPAWCYLIARFEKNWPLAGSLSIHWGRTASSLHLWICTSTGIFACSGTTR